MIRVLAGFAVLGIGQQFVAPLDLARGSRGRAGNGMAVRLRPTFGKRR